MLQRSQQKLFHGFFVLLGRMAKAEPPLRVKIGVKISSLRLWPSPFELLLFACCVDFIQYFACGKQQGLFCNLLGGNYGCLGVVARDIPQPERIHTSVDPGLIRRCQTPFASNVTPLNDCLETRAPYPTPPHPTPCTEVHAPTCQSNAHVC